MMNFDLYICYGMGDFSYEQLRRIANIALQYDALYNVRRELDAMPHHIRCSTSFLLFFASDNLRF